MVNPKQIVREGYDRVSFAYRGDDADPVSPYLAWLGKLTPFLSRGDAILDLGCGCGIPVAKALATDFTVTGVDLSPVQIERARRLVPGARFLCADMCELDFAPATFAAVVSFYAVIHVPLAEQPGLFARMARWLRPGGPLLATVGLHAWTGTEADWLGVPGAVMYWSHADAATYRNWLTDAGLTVLWEQRVPEGEGGHCLLLARSASGDAGAEVGDVRHSFRKQ